MIKVVRTGDNSMSAELDGSGREIIANIAFAVKVFTEMVCEDSGSNDVAGMLTKVIFDVYQFAVANVGEDMDTEGNNDTGR